MLGKSSESEALEYGIDLSLLERNLRLDPEERLLEHETALALVEAIQGAGIGTNVRSQKHS